MFVFRWKLPDSAKPRELRLEIRSFGGWIGPKRLYLDDAEIYRRGWFEGINHTFLYPGKPGQQLELKAAESLVRGQWKPTLTLNYEPVPEETGTAPPHNSQRPRLLAIVTGVTYLAMFMMFIMLPHIQKMLYASYGQSDSRVFVLEVAGDERPEGDLRLDKPALPPAAVGRPFEAKPAVLGGAPPYALKRLMGITPEGLQYDDATGLISGTPKESGDFLIRIRVTDSTDHFIEWPCVISVAPEEDHAPRIITNSLPVARENEEYSAPIQVEGGLPPYNWVINKRKLPNGVSFRVLEDDEETEQAQTRVEGTPKPLPAAQGQTPESIAGPYPLRVRVTDARYSPWEDIFPWVLPFVATSICLLGYWNMRRWSVVLLGLAIAAQVGLALASMVSVSIVAVVLQLGVLAVGAATFSKMR